MKTGILLTEMVNRVSVRSYMRSGYCEIPLKFAQCVKIESEYFLIDDFNMKVFNQKPIRIIIEDVYQDGGIFGISKWELRVNGTIVEGNRRAIASLGIPGLEATNFSQDNTIKRAANLAMYLITKCSYHQLNDRLTDPKDIPYSPRTQGRYILLQKDPPTSVIVTNLNMVSKETDKHV